MRVVITHDFYETYGGAERVTAEIARAFPDAPVYAILGRPEVAERMGIADRVHPVLPAGKTLLRRYRGLAPAYPAMVRNARLPEADVVISSSYAYAHGFRTPNGAPKLCYCHGPLRHLWSQSEAYAEHLPLGAAGRRAFELYLRPARRADLAAAGDTDAFLTQSPFTAQLIRNVYGREPEILPPPVDCDVFRPSGRPAEDYFLFVGRLVEAYKRPSLVVEAFTRMQDRRLIVVGDGPALGTLTHMATPNIEFRGQLEDAELVSLMQGCQATIFPSVDDYGLVPVEVNACGRPVLAARAGGCLHTVKPGVTGEYLREQSAQAIVEAVRAFDPERYAPAEIRAHALRRSSREFHRELRAAATRLVRPQFAPQPPAVLPRPVPAPVAVA